jgi:hypothetical protein
MNNLNHLLATLNLPHLGLMNLGVVDFIIPLKLGYLILVDNGWLVAFCKRKTISSFSLRHSLNLDIFYLGFSFIVPQFVA